MKTKVKTFLVGTNYPSTISLSQKQYQQLRYGHYTRLVVVKAGTDNVIRTTTKVSEVLATAHRVTLTGKRGQEFVSPYLICKF